MLFFQVYAVDASDIAVQVAHCSNCCLTFLFHVTIQHMEALCYRKIGIL